MKENDRATRIFERQFSPTSATCPVRNSTNSEALFTMLRSLSDWRGARAAATTVPYVLPPFLREL